MSTDWHVGDTLMQRYLDGGTDMVLTASIEAHVMRCGSCRGALAHREDVEGLDTLWTGVRERIETPSLPPWPLRVLARLGLPGDDLVVLAASRDLLLSWSVAIGAALACAVLSAFAPARLPGGSHAVFLMLAPLVPVLAVVTSYDATDPFREITEASPFSALRLALLRTAGALVAAVPTTVGVALVIPGLTGYFASWLLPGLALTVAALVLLTWLTAWVASGVVVVAWLLATSIAAGARTLEVVATAGGQAAFAVVVVAVAALLVRVATTQRAGWVAR